MMRMVSCRPETKPAQARQDRPRVEIGRVVISRKGCGEDYITTGKVKERVPLQYYCRSFQSGMLGGGPLSEG